MCMQETVNKSPKPMVRKQVLITADQNRRLKAHALAIGRPESDLIRAALDRELSQPQADQEHDNGDDWRMRLAELAGSVPEAKHLEQTIKENRERWRRRNDATRRKMRGDE